jgi:glycosyltransferase involved in cell wall biosynthesis
MNDGKKYVVHFAHRSPGIYRSIEELFNTISSMLSKTIKCTESQAPFGNVKLCSVISNMLWARGLSGCDIVHQTGDIHYVLLAVTSKITVLTIHDLRFLEESRGLKRLLFHWFWFQLPCRKVDRVTVISEFTRSRLLELVPVDPLKIRVIPNCVADEFQPSTRTWPQRPRVLLVGSTPNKNLKKVISVLQDASVDWIILGKLDEVQIKFLNRFGVKWEAYHDLSRMEVVSLYQTCDLLCFLSTYEGFGMPILEAQAVRIPVFTSKYEPMSTVAGSGALKVNPMDDEEIRDNFRILLSDSELRKKLVIAGDENVKKYKSKIIAQQYAELYQEVIKEKNISSFS